MFVYIFVFVHITKIGSMFAVLRSIGSYFFSTYSCAILVRLNRKRCGFQNKLY
jgi:hypothetical protein